MSYFKDFNFVRAITILSLIGAIALGYKAWEQYGQIQEMEIALAEGGEIEKLVAKIQQSAQIYTQLSEERTGDQLVALDSVDLYIRKAASKSRVGIGQVKITHGERAATGLRGVVDITATIVPMVSESTFSRTQIANFLFTLENESSRVRVTELEFNNAQRSLKPEDIPADTWKYKCKITSREKKNDG